MVPKAKKKQTNLTPAQKEFLEGIALFKEEYGYDPSQREIAEYLGFQSVGTVQHYKKILEDRGFLQAPQQRGLQVIPQVATTEAINLPLVGKVAAGVPIEAIERADTVDIPASMIGAGEHFVLEVEGHSMIEDAILDGDLVVIKKQKTAHNGDTVVALVNNEATIKRFYKKRGHIELHPANADYDIIHIDPSSDFHIEGVLKGLIRK